MTTKPVVLAVDDDPVNLDIIRRTLEKTGVELHFARNGAAALDVLNAGQLRFDLVILDRMMPGMDGLEVLRTIKRTKELMRLPVILQTAAAGPAQVEEGLNAGAYYYLTKPYSPAALRTIVSSALEDGLRRRDLEARIVSREVTALRWLETASFTISSLDEVGELAALLSATCPDPEGVYTGLTELLTNAIEHGNLNISYAEKSRLKRENQWAEEVARRATLPEYNTRRVRVCVERSPESLSFRIADQGHGFEWQRFLDFDSARAFDPNGRGIALSRKFCFNDLRYEGCGNVAVASVSLV